MKLKLILIFVANILYAQNNTDMVTPKSIGVNEGVSIDGLIENSVNEVTGKVIQNISFGSISCRSLSHNIGLVYNGKSAFDTAKNANKYNPTSIVGVGFGFINPKIIVDHKNTTTFHDDQFFLMDGVVNSKLICVKYEFASNNEYSLVYAEFATEKMSNLKIVFERGVFKVINDEGATFYYGNEFTPNSNASEYAVSWGNWIGDSNLNYGGVSKTIVWNLSRINDGKKNNIYFDYEVVEQSMAEAKQTEASYLTKIYSDTGDKIEFVYDNKNASEYYEPHQETSEPDAYQERYEKKILSEVSFFNSKGNIKRKYKLDYKLLFNENGDQKRYLTKITQVSKTGKTLPFQEFEYYETGKFKGGLKKVIYPLGGSLSYEYEEKFLFNNFPNNYNNAEIDNNGLVYLSTITRDNYVLVIFKNTNNYRGIYYNSGDREGTIYDLKIRRYFWNGEKWEVSENDVQSGYFSDINPNNPNNIDFFFQEDYYGYVYETNYPFQDAGHEIMIHYLSKYNANLWNTYITRIGGKDGNFQLLYGDNFLAYANNTYGYCNVLNRSGDDWIYNSFTSLAETYYVARNNYIISIDKNQNYNLYYLDATKLKWINKKWFPGIKNINGFSYLYGDNTHVGIMAGGPEEFLFTWDSAYNLESKYNLGYSHDGNPLFPVNNSMFTMQTWYKTPLNSFRYNGKNWILYKYNIVDDDYTQTTYGVDKIGFQNYKYSGQINYNKIGLLYFNPNKSVWNFMDNISSSNGVYEQVTGITPEFMIAGDKVFRFNNKSDLSTDFLQVESSIGKKNNFTFTDGLYNVFTSFKDNSSGYESGVLFNINKEKDIIQSFNLGTRYNMTGSIGGNSQFLSSKAMFLKNKNLSSNFTPFLYRIINDSPQGNVLDVVVKKIKINNGVSDRVVEYNYDDFYHSVKDDIFYYGNVSIENRGAGNSSLGKIVKIFHNGKLDESFKGILKEEFVKDINNNILTQKIYTWEKYVEKNFHKRLRINLVGVEEKIFAENSSNFFSKKKVFKYSNDLKYDLLVETSEINSDGKVYKTETNYAFMQDEYKYFEGLNLIKLPYKVISKIDEKVVNSKKSIWNQYANTYPYISETYVSSDDINYRSSGKVTKLDSFGNILEVDNSYGIKSVVLYGYMNSLPILTVSNEKYDNCTAGLDVSQQILQTLDNANLKKELIKLYSKTSAAVEITLYDEDGNVIEKINNREYSTKYFYDEFGRIDYITDSFGNVIKKNMYNLNR